MLQNAASLRKPALWASGLLKCLIDISLVSRSSSNAHDCHRFWKLLRNPHVWLTDLEMCLAPKRRALFRHLNFQKWSEHVVCLLYHLDFHMCFDVLRPTTACNFSSLFSPDGAYFLSLCATFLPFRTPVSFVCWLFLFWPFLFPDFPLEYWNITYYNKNKIKCHPYVIQFLHGCEMLWARHAKLPRHWIQSRPGHCHWKPSVVAPSDHPA